MNIERSRRDGRDLALYGGQVRARFEPGPKVALSLSAGDLFFSGTQSFRRSGFWQSAAATGHHYGPATATTPAQTITTQISIPRDLLVAGNGNLGVTNASNMQQTVMPSGVGFQSCRLAGTPGI